MELIILIGKMFIISWLVTRFQPITMILDVLPDKLIYNLIRLLLSCLMCFSFWFTLIMTGSIVTASIAAFVGFWYDKILGSIENRIRL